MTTPETLTLSVEQDGDRVRVLAPAVGRWTEIPADGAVVGGGATLGTLRQLHREFRLALPQGIRGSIELPDPRRARPVSFGETLFVLTPLTSADGDAAAAGASGATKSDDGLLAFRAPTDGVFYSRAAPDVPPFVSVGQRIQRGQPIGLIEVMKTFNQILYDGDSLPEQGTVKEIRVSDGEEVSAGQALIVVE